MAFNLTLHQDNNPAQLVTKHFTIKCPHCNAISGLSAISLPQHNLLIHYKPKNAGIAYQCDACQETVFLRFIIRYFPKHVEFDDDFIEVEHPHEDYEYKYLPAEVADDFKEALTCYSNSCYNAFGAMIRRTIQTVSTELGAEGKDKVQNQIKELKDILKIEEETFDQLKVIILAGHDGAHPHLPSLNHERAEILLEIMKDVLYQLFIRRKKIQEAEKKRQQAIQQKNDE